MATVYSLNPGAIADQGTTGGPAFTLSRPEWIAIQTYVTNALALPTTGDAFKKSLGSGAPGDLSDFQQLIAAYQGINTHVTTWQQTVYPATVSLASDIYDYGINKAPVFFPPILKEADILVANPGDEQAKAALKAIIDNLQADADTRATRASDVAGQVKAFAEDTAADKSVLVGPDGKTGLVAYYDNKYGATSQDVQNITKEINAQKILLTAANDEYNHDVVVAATTPSYAWVWPVGTIAAAIVAGVYGHKAVEALDRAHAAQDKITTLAAQLAADANLMIAINSAQLGMNAITRDLSAALPVVQKIQGVWGGLADDLRNISHLIDTDIRQVPPIIMSLGVDEATKAWHNVALAADAYRVNAYVTEVGGPADSMAAWKLGNQFASSAAAA